MRHVEVQKQDLVMPNSDIEKLMTNYFSKTPAHKAAQIITAFQANPIIWHRAEQPEILTILCKLFAETQNIGAMARQFTSITELYEEMKLTLSIDAYRNNQEAATDELRLKTRNKDRKKGLGSKQCNTFKN